ncbi:amino acid/amide ABC transporter ATP-binding protein 2 (HAAT family) [Murinocardiopsis flavida]|uniref:Amino acid/amide ABC transporter ATP-binding protein 2 (HAAT family) n=1 Tax=Murinocardiopsis flavida TaxID=645275 RepID=A0A2P8DSU0_9ACTN|nr:ABC transporter ATP-binding protein [Murinocardiopsis flavida]PSL00289.1 amino acid/amide ABC transporter ATP-binding protein 2 (HAAT family) [Murinocardiopsis flavida]
MSEPRTGTGATSARADNEQVPDPVFEIRDIEAGYGRAALVLRGLSVTVTAGSVVCLVGPNGAGKSTVLKVASGLLAPRSGSVLLKGADVTGLGTRALLAKGIAHVLQGHSVFREMTVEENVRLGAYTVGDAELVEQRCARVREVFPVVGERWDATAGLLSGGQQKQVELARAMMLDPAVVLLDEPSMGLDPKTTTALFDQIARMRELGTAVLLVEQNARRALEMADVGCVLDLGRVHISGPAADLLADPALGRLYLGAAPNASAASGAPDAATAPGPRPPADDEPPTNTAPDDGSRP